MPDLTMQTVVQVNNGELTNFCQKSSGDGTVFLCWQVNLEGTNDSILQVEHRDAGNHVLATWIIHPPAPPSPPIKFSTSGLAAIGTRLVAYASGHEVTVPAPPHRGNYGMAVVLPVAFVPTGAPGDGAFSEEVLTPTQPTPAPDPTPTPGEPVDYARIQSMIDGGFAGLVTKFGGGSVRGGLQEKVADALVWLFNAPDTDPRILVARAFRDAFYGQATNIAWAEEWKVAIESGQVDKALAPPPIRAMPGFPWGR